MRDLKLQGRTWRSRSRAQQGRAPTLIKESPKKQVQFDFNEELGGKPTLPTGMTLFLSGGGAVEQYTTPTPAKMEPVNAPWPDYEEGPQWSPTPTRGSRPKVWSSISPPWSKPERPDLVSPHRWIHVELLKIPHRYWWRTLMPCGQMTMFTHILCENFSPSYGLLAGGSLLAGYLWPNTKLQVGGLLHLQSPDFGLNNTCLPLLPPTSG